MTKDRPAPRSGPDPSRAKSDRDDRLKAALQANLARRKGQAKQKQAQNDTKPADRTRDKAEEI